MPRKTTPPLKIAFFDTKPYDRRFFDAANRKFGFEIIYFESKLNRMSARMAEGCDAVCVFVNDTVDAAVIDELVKAGVRFVALRCAGYNNVNLAYAYGKLLVTRVPGYSPYAVAEYALAMLLTLDRQIHRAYTRVRDNNFSINGLLGFDLRNKTIGIIGTGRIGGVFANLLTGFGVNLIGYDSHPNAELAERCGLRYVTLEEMFKTSDAISLHCPLTPDNLHLIDERAIGMMKRGVFIINTSRGKLIDTRALIEGLKNGTIGAAGLDVYEEESDYFFEDLSNQAVYDDQLARLLTFPNVLVTSHQAFFTREAMTNIAAVTLQNLDDCAENRELANGICTHCDGSRECPGKTRPCRGGL